MVLPKSEEQLMQHLWRLGKAFMKELLDAYEEPKPAATTVATLLKRLQDKSAVGFKQFGNVKEYYPLLKKEDYSASQMNGMLKNYFDDSISQFASFFTSKQNLNDHELEELQQIVEAQIKARKK